MMETPSILSLLVPAWLLLIATGLLLNLLVVCKESLPLVFRDVLEYGKVKLHQQRRGVLALFNVPKRWFMHFYVWGFLWTSVLLLQFTLSCIAPGGPTLPGVGLLLHVLTGDLMERECIDVTQYHFDTFVMLILVLLHVSQRLSECVCVHVPSSSKMHIVHYFYGLYYYTALALTPLLHTAKGVSDPTPKVTLYNAPFETLLSHFLRWRHIVGVLLFLWASYQQNRCHRILASLRLKDGSDHDSDRPLYAVPSGGWFRYVSCPHYLAELLKYVGVGVCVGDWSSSWWLVPLVSLLVLALSARQTHAWYQHKFEDYPKNRRALIPFVL